MNTSFADQWLLLTGASSGFGAAAAVAFAQQGARLLRGARRVDRLEQGSGQARAAKVYEGINTLTPEDIGETILWIASRPAHVSIDEIIIKTTDQAAIPKVFCRPVPK
jgi:NADP-dependent 3-hydroxy acid dehydrogenase YdfG